MSKKVTIVHEQNSFPGVTNKILSKVATKVLTSFEDSHKRFPEKSQDKLVLTGNPVRKEILQARKYISRKNLGISEDKKMVLCYGGSGGSEEINDAMRLVIENMVKEDVAFIFATGKVYYEEFIESIKDIELKPYQRVMPYLDNMADGLAASDIVIGSAGAISLAEITALGKPSIIIPKAYTAENHQEYNAKSIEAQGAGIAILEKDLTPQSLNDAVFKLLGDKELLIDMANNAKKIGKPEAIDLIYNEIMKSYNETVGSKNKKENNIKKEVGIDIDAKQMIKRTSFWFYFVWAILLSASGLALISQASGIVNEIAKNIDASSVATIVGLISICNGIGRVIYGGMFDKFGRLKTMITVVVVFLVSSILLVLAFNTKSLIILIVGFILCGASYGGVTSVNSAFINLFYGATNYPVNFSIVNLNLIIASFGSTIAGMLYDYTGSYISTTFLMIGGIICSFICTICIKRP